MSAEIAKKRGRPKKVISDPIEVEISESKKSTTRAKSTKAAPKTAKATPTATKKTPVAATPATPAAKPASKPPPPTSATKKPAPKPPAAVPPKPAAKPPVTPETSKILEQVRELASKTVPAPADPSKYSKPSPITVPAESSAQTSTPPNPILSTNKSPIPPQEISSKPISNPATSNPPPKIPIAQINKEIVSDISSRAGARPNKGGSGLPPNYKSVSRKVTMAIVAMPILIVTSYVLYERLVLGEDRKVLVNPSLTKVETSGDDVKTSSS